MRYEVKQDPNDNTQWIIWDDLESRVFARFDNKDEPIGIINRFYAAQLAAETSGA